MKTHFRKLPPKIISYRDFVKFDISNFLSEKQKSFLFTTIEILKSVLILFSKLA